MEGKEILTVSESTSPVGVLTCLYRLSVCVFVCLSVPKIDSHQVPQHHYWPVCVDYCIATSRHRELDFVKGCPECADLRSTAVCCLFVDLYKISPTTGIQVPGQLLVMPNLFVCLYVLGQPIIQVPHSILKTTAVVRSSYLITP